MTNPYVFRLLLALVGLVALLAVLITVTLALEGEPSPWVTGGAVTVAVTGTFALLSSLGKGGGRK